MHSKNYPLSLRVRFVIMQLFRRMIWLSYVNSDCVATINFITKIYKSYPNKSVMQLEQKTEFRKVYNCYKKVFKSIVCRFLLFCFCFLYQYVFF